MAVFGVDGRMLASSGVLHYNGFKEASSPAYAQYQRSGNVDVVVEEVTSGNVSIDDLFSPSPGAQVCLQ